MMGRTHAFVGLGDRQLHSSDSVIVNYQTLTSVQLVYGIDGQKFQGAQHGGASGTRIVVSY